MLVSNINFGTDVLIPYICDNLHKMIRDCKDRIAHWMNLTDQALVLAKYWRERAREAEKLNEEWKILWDEHIECLKPNKN